MSNPTAVPFGRLMLRVTMHEPRYHGRPDWPPSPARLFQALVAGAGRGRGLSPEDTATLRWLETLAPPTIGSPRCRLGSESTLFVPNNDLDAKGGDPARVAEIRASKRVLPRLLEADVPFLYVWRFADRDSEWVEARKVCALAEALYQFGRGVDMAWAVGAALDEEAAGSQLAAYAGQIVEPAGGGTSNALACPEPGSLDRLIARFEASAHRFTMEGTGRRAVQVFAQPPMVRFAEVVYGGAAESCLFELQLAKPMGKTAAWPLVRAHDLVVAIRDVAVRHLHAGMPEQSAAIDDVLVGRQPGATTSVPLEHRVRIVPIPSVGHEQVDQGIRRILVIIPRAGPLAPEDVVWAFSRVTLEDGALLLSRTDQSRMLNHYGWRGDRGRRVWRTVTPCALPNIAKRRRIDPASITSEAKGAEERGAEEQRGRTAVGTALRQADVRNNVRSVRVQREPFDRKGMRAETFAEGTRFEKERLWHVEVELDRPEAGPLVIGDGRFLGLGVMRLIDRQRSVIAFSIASGLAPNATPEEIASGLRRAAIARVQDTIGPRKPIPALVSGHDAEGAPANGGPRAHYVFDAPRHRLLIICPEDTTSARGERDFELLMVAMEGLVDLRAGRSGRLQICSMTVDVDSDPLFAPAFIWKSVTPYAVNRHESHGDAGSALAADLRQSCRDRGLPEPLEVRVDSIRAAPGIGLTGVATIRFATAVRGPLLLGRTRFKGGGLFAAA